MRDKKRKQFINIFCVVVFCVTFCFPLSSKADEASCINGCYADTASKVVACGVLAGSVYAGCVFVFHAPLQCAVAAVLAGSVCLSGVEAQHRTCIANCKNE